MTGLKRILDKITDDATAEARAILTEAEAECRAVAEELGKRGIAERDTVILEAEAEVERYVSHAKSAVETDRRRILQDARTRMIDRAFSLAAAEIRDTDFGKYRALLSTLIVCAMLDVARAEDESLALGDEVAEYDRAEVVLNAADRAKLGTAVVGEARRDLERRIGAARAAKLCLSDDTAEIDGGLVLRCGNIETNCSLSVLLAEIRAEMEGRVGEILFPTPPTE